MSVLLTFVLVELRRVSGRSLKIMWIRKRAIFFFLLNVLSFSSLSRPRSVFGEETGGQNNGKERKKAGTCSFFSDAKTFRNQKKPSVPDCVNPDELDHASGIDGDDPPRELNA